VNPGVREKPRGKCIHAESRNLGEKKPRESLRDKERAGNLRKAVLHRWGKSRGIGHLAGPSVQKKDQENRGKNFWWVRLRQGERKRKRGAKTGLAWTPG